MAEMWPNAEFSLGLSMPVKSHTLPPQAAESRERKGKGQTSYSKRMVRNAAWYLETRVTKVCLSFLTTTLPDRAVDILEAREDAAALWSEINRQYFQWIKRRLFAADLMDEIVGCYEPQPERWKKSGKVALHSHVLFQGRKDKKSKWVIDKTECLKRWLDIVSSVLGEQIESTSATRIERVVKSAQNYLAKYMSKAGNIIDEIAAAGKTYMLPSQWWVCSSDLRKLIKSMCIEISQEAQDVLYSRRNELKEQGIIQWFFVQEIEFHQPHGEPFKIPVAYCGKLAKPEYMEMFNY